MCLQLRFFCFRSFSPTPRGLEFRPGQDYYFISTSSKRDLLRRVGGSCSTHNMKVIFKVAQSAEHKELVQPSINVARDLSSSEENSLTGYKDIVRPIEDVRSFHSGLDHITKGRYDRWGYCGIIRFILSYILVRVAMKIFEGFGKALFIKARTCINHPLH